MNIVKFMVTVDKDRHVVIDLPADTPIGPAEIVVRSLERPTPQANVPYNPAHEAARAKRLAAGFLVPDKLGIPAGLTPHHQRSANDCRNCSPIQTSPHGTPLTRIGETIERGLVLSGYECTGQTLYRWNWFNKED